jgi:hypothetical protein
MKTSGFIEALSVFFGLFDPESWCLFRLMLSRANAGNGGSMNIDSFTPIEGGDPRSHASLDQPFEILATKSKLSNKFLR